MKMILNDFSRYSFIAQLSRTLAAREIGVNHLYCSTQTTTPEGAINYRPGDPGGLDFTSIALRSTLNKYSLFRRRKQEIEYGKKAAACLLEYRPNLILSANTPLDAQVRLWESASAIKAKRIFWMQDVISVAVEKIVAKRIPVFGSALSAYYRRMEKTLLRQSDAIVVISPAFKALLISWGIAEDRIHVIQNWAPLDEVKPKPKDNPWSRARMLSDKFVFLYSGTLSLKHNPELLLKLARGVESKGAVVVVRSQGKGADWLRSALQIESVPNLLVEDYGPYGELPDALGAADVLLVLLEPDASQFSVPSKALTYMCAGRPILAAVPVENLMAQSVIAANAGMVVDPTDPEGLCSAGEALVESSSLKAYGANARVAAESNFNIEKIADRFQKIFDEVLSSP